MSVIGKYASLVKFSHTLFAMPFALVSYVYALTSAPNVGFEWLLLVKILFCMVFARNTAMGFNRWADRKFDALNPRTAGREIPSGRISPQAALIFTIFNAAGFMIVAGTINKLTLILSPVALFIITGYSLTKRFTAWCHVVLGTALAIAPAGAYIAVTGTLTAVPVLLGCIVLTWSAGFDVLYALQDKEFDDRAGLHSIPSRFSVKNAVIISYILHLITAYTVLLLGFYGEYPAGAMYWIGAGCFIAMLILQQYVFRGEKLPRIAKAFGLINGLSSVVFGIFAITDLLL